MSLRAEKVASVIKRCVSQPISTMALEMSAGLATVTAVRVSPDLHYAKIYMSLYANKIGPGEFLQKIEERQYELKKILSKELQTRFMPELKFFLDDTLDQIDSIQKLLDNVKKADDDLKKLSGANQDAD